MRKRIEKLIKVSLLSIGILIALFLLIALLYGHRDIPVSELKEKYAPSPSLFVSIGGMDVHYRNEGNSSESVPLVLIHGTGSSLHTFDSWVDELKKDYRVIRMDLPGFGLTGPFPDRNYSIENYVVFIEDFLSSQGIKSCVLAGNSLGGQIAWRFTVKNPQTVEKLILIDAAGYPRAAKSEPIAFKIAGIPLLNKVLTFITPRSIVRSSVENVYADKTKVNEVLVDRYFDLSLREGNRQALVDRIKSFNDPDPIGLIKTIQKPTLVLWGEKDLLIPLEIAHRFHQDLPNDSLVILKDLGHVPMEESPVESLGPVLSFLDN